MKRFRLLAVLGALALCTATVVWGDYNVLDKGTYHQNATNGARVTSLGHATTQEQNDLGTQVSGWIPLINDTTAVGMADSSAVQTQYAGYVLHGIQIRASLPGAPPSAVNPFIRLAVSVRTHVNGIADSVSTSPVFLTHNLTAIAAGADSLKFGALQAPTSLALEDGEFIVTLSRSDANAAKWSSGISRFIPIEVPGASATGVRLPNFSIRVRVLSATANTNTIVVNGYATMLR